MAWADDRPPAVGFVATTTPSRGWVLEFALGMGALQTQESHYSYVYRDCCDDYPLVLDVAEQTMAPGLSVLGSWAAFGGEPGALLFEPYLDMQVMAGGFTGGRIGTGMRGGLNRGDMRPWASLGVGLGYMIGTLATVPLGNNTGADFLIAPDGSHVKTGEDVTVSASTLGVDARVGVSYWVSPELALVANLGFSIYGTIDDWGGAKAENEDGETVVLTRDIDLPSAGLTGPSAFVGLAWRLK